MAGQEGVFSMWRLMFAGIVCGCALVGRAEGATYTAAKVLTPPNSTLTNPPEPAEMGLGGITVGLATRTVGSNTNFAAYWTPDGVGREFSGVLPSGANSQSLGINNNGEIALRYGTSIVIAHRPNPVSQPNTWAEKRLISNAIPLGLVRFNSSGFNERGEIALTSADGLASYFSPTGVRTSLNFIVESMNNSGVFIGYNQFGSVTNGVATYGTFPTPAGFTTVRAFDINDSGVVVGRAETAVASIYQPFTYTNADGYEYLPLPVGYISGTANSINTTGDVVGSVYDGTTRTAALWRNGSVSLFKDMTTGTLPSNSAIASEISDDGYVYIYGTLNSSFYATILSPVPEPAALSSIAIGLLLLGRRRRP
jgi:hypothetical protein